MVFIVLTITHAEHNAYVSRDYLKLISYWPHVYESFGLVKTHMNSSNMQLLHYRRETSTAQVPYVYSDTQHLVTRKYLVHLLKTFIAGLQPLDNLQLNLSELDGLHHLLEVIQLVICLVQQ